MTWVLAGVAAAGAITSGVEANQTRQRNKGIISKAYQLGQQRLNLTQGDTRESQAESLGARGLAGSGTVNDPGSIGPQTGAAPLSVGGAHDLGGQAVADERREQQLEQTGLKQESQNDLTENNAAADSAEIGAGIKVAGDVAGGIAGKKPSNTIPPTANATPTSLGLGGDAVPSVPTQSPYGNAWGGIDPVNPTVRGSWSTGSGGNTSTGSFNKFVNPNP